MVAIAPLVKEMLDGVSADSVAACGLLGLKQLLHPVNNQQETALIELVEHPVHQG